jgi:hypothetical protein
MSDVGRVPALEDRHFHAAVGQIGNGKRGLFGKPLHSNGIVPVVKREHVPNSSRRMQQSRGEPIAEKWAHPRSIGCDAEVLRFPSE